MTFWFGCLLAVVIYLVHAFFGPDGVDYLLIGMSIMAVMCIFLVAVVASINDGYASRSRYRNCKCIHCRARRNRR